MKVALYVRVSTEDQAKEGYSIRGQESKLRAYADSQGWTIHDLYVDEGYSAKNLDRPAMQKMKDDIRAKMFDIVLVYKLDRMVRSVVDLYEMLHLFDENNVYFKSATEMFDTSTATGRMFITLVATLAQWERELLSERTTDGMRKRFEEGNRNGGKAPFGYDLNENGSLVINEEEARWVKWLFEEVKVKGKKALAKELNNNGIRTNKGSLWNASTVDYVLNNPVYCGGLRWNYRTKKGSRTFEEIVVPGEHEAIITETLFYEVQSARRKRKQKGFKGHAIYPFTSILKCQRCGHNIIGGSRKRSDGSRYRFYKCNGRFVYGECDLPVIGENVIEEHFISMLDIIDVDVEPPEEEKFNEKEIKQQLHKVSERIDRLEELYIEGDISKDRYREKLMREKEKESELHQTLNQKSHSVSKYRPFLKPLPLNVYNLMVGAEIKKL